MRYLYVAGALAILIGCTAKEATINIVCPVGAAYCGSGCSRLEADPSNCGACGHACPSGQTCSGGACADPVATCSGGLTSCGGDCVDTQSSRIDCGGCGHVCDIHQDCQAGACALRCQADLALCGSACANLDSDEQNCGSCGAACRSGETCAGGACRAPCAAGLTGCGLDCVDTATDQVNCGSCGHVCGGGSSCVAGSCQCGAGQSLCGGTCLSTTSDAANCGACGTVCASGTCLGSVCAPVCDKTLCGAACVDPQTDGANCGACGRACLNGETCTAGSCTCPAGSQACGSSTACVDLASDGDHCGACGSPCPVGQTCVAGTCSDDVGAFRMLGGDAGHSGLNPGETGVPPLTQAWVAPGAGGQGPAVIEGGRVLSLGGSRLHALEASSGAELWSYSFATVYGGIGWPAVSGGKVYVATSSNSGDTWLRQFDRDTGAVEFKSAFGSQWERYWSPIVVGNSVYLNGGSYGGLYGFDALAGSQRFFASLEQYDEWSPAYFGGKVYTFVAGNLRAHDPDTGAVQGTPLNVGWTWSGWSMQTAPAFGDSYGYVISPPNLIAFDPTTLAQVWKVNSAYTAYPAVAGGVVYALSNGNLHALNAVTGARMWLFTGDDKLAYPPVVAAGYVYVASDSNVYAVDVNTHRQVWTAATGGRLAVGAGMLLVSRASDGSLVAFRLSR